MTTSSIATAVEVLEAELAVLEQRRQLVEQALDLCRQLSGTITPPAPAAAPLAVRSVEPKPKPTKAKPKPAEQRRTLTKWNYDEVATVIDAGTADGKTAVQAIVDYYDVNAGMAQYLLKRVRSRLAAAEHLPKGPSESGQFSPADALAAIEAA
jgi:hypothetical protein